MRNFSFWGPSRFIVVLLAAAASGQWMCPTPLCPPTAHRPPPTEWPTKRLANPLPLPCAYAEFMKLGQFCVDDPSAPRRSDGPERVWERARDSASAHWHTLKHTLTHTHTNSYTHTHSFVMQLIHFFAWHSIRFRHSVHFVYYEAAPAPNDLRPAQLALFLPLCLLFSLVNCMFGPHSTTTAATRRRS